MADKTRQSHDGIDDILRSIQNLTMNNRAQVTSSPIDLIVSSPSYYRINQQTGSPVLDSNRDQEEFLASQARLVSGDNSSQLHNLGYNLNIPANWEASYGRDDLPNSYLSTRTMGGEGCFYPYAAMHSVANATTIGIPSYDSSSRLCRSVELQNQEDQPDINLTLRSPRARQGWSDQKIRKLLRCDSSLLNELQGEEILMLAKDPLGSYYLQRILDFVTSRKILDGVTYRTVDLMSNRLGSSVFQKLLNYCNQEQMDRIVYGIISESERFASVALTDYGSCSIQKLLKTLRKWSSSCIEVVIQALIPSFFYLMIDLAARRLVSYCLKHLTYEQNKFIYQVETDHCLDLARDKQGYQVLTSIIDTIRDHLREFLLAKITEHSVHLSQEPYGNFVVQKVLQLEHPSITAIICNKLKNNIVQLSMHKHSSHVIEKCVKSTFMELVISELLKSNKLIQLARDQYGNYVIQSVLSATKARRPDLFQRLVDSMIPQLESLQNHPNARNVFNILYKELSLPTVEHISSLGRKRKEVVLSS